MDRELFRNWNYANGDEYSLRISDISPLYEAIRVNNVDLIDNLLKQGENINGSVLPYGPFAGYTILHFACMSEDKSFVERLLFVYNANPNTEAKDGARPITVAVLSKKKRIVSLLLRSGANVDEELSNSIQIKYKSSFKSPEDEWCNDFGSRMTLLTYAVLNNHIELVDILLKYHADWKIRSRSNKTLLMCAVDKLQEQIVESLVKVMSKDELNLRDNDGFTALHYLAKRNELKCRYHASTLKSGPIVRILLLLLTAGADINIKVNGHWAEDIWIIRDLRFRQVVGVPAFEEALLIMHNLLKTGFLHGERLGSRMSIVKILFDELKSHSITFDGQTFVQVYILSARRDQYILSYSDYN
ncbi:ankyrin repeat domain-containing protein 29-like [Microplitis mediator]|uniref:ankyrin repeat domain-containing protein 29-like n=1 Tax=Microplitis mediator TaxID=375433 RepID=UPI002554DCFB|nr:ankyrin repeat domain-containing protein 29-like [Microplitis mediator]